MCIRVLLYRLLFPYLDVYVIKQLTCERCKRTFINLYPINVYTNFVTKTLLFAYFRSSS